MKSIPLAQTSASLPQEQYLYAAAAVLVLAVLLFILIRRQPKKVKAYATDNGEVMVSRAAIVELVQTSCEQIKEVSKPQVRMRVKGGQKHFEVRLKLASGGHLRAIESMLQAHLRKALTENLGIENLGQINILATGFKSGRMEASSSIAKKQPETDPTRTEEAEAAAESDYNSDDSKESKADP
ncbi:MAG: alkaline shock response membrane anchor protein AmaP [Opitutales bacterium]